MMSSELSCTKSVLIVVQCAPAPLSCVLAVLGGIGLVGIVGLVVLSQGTFEAVTALGPSSAPHGLC